VKRPQAGRVINQFGSGAEILARTSQVSELPVTATFLLVGAWLNGEDLVWHEFQEAPFRAPRRADLDKAAPPDVVDDRVGRARQFAR
jgi:hypothetical protein